MSGDAGSLLFLVDGEDEEHEQEEDDEECNDPFDQCGNVTLQVRPSFVVWIDCSGRVTRTVSRSQFSIVHAILTRFDSYRCGCACDLGEGEFWCVMENVSCGSERIVRGAVFVMICSRRVIVGRGRDVVR
jgi:hypothetical protein